MSETLFLLQLEHQHVGELLDLLDEQLEAMEKGRPWNHELLHAALEYFSEFTNQCHHPKEDHVYRKLQENAPDAANRLVFLLSEHAQITELTRQYADRARENESTPGQGLENLQATLRTFINFNRAHMTREEKLFFPAAIKHLSEADWAEIDFALFDREEPLSVGSSRGHFAQLQERIARLAEPGRRRVAAQEYIQDHSQVLATLRSIEDFNLWVNRLRERFYLVRYSSGEYGLENDQQVIMAIPECGEQQAVWCAYYYIVGYSTPD